MTVIKEPSFESLATIGFLLNSLEYLTINSIVICDASLNEPPFPQVKIFFSFFTVLKLN